MKMLLSDSSMLRRALFRRAAHVVLVAVGMSCATAGGAAVRERARTTVQFVFTSDVHYGLTRASFRGESNVPADVVNQAVVRSINSLPDVVLPADGGLGGGTAIGAIDFVAVGGDIANRSERLETGAIQSATISWASFERDYDRGLTVRDASGRRAPLLVVPGNHDASNAVGFHRPMMPGRDPAAMVAMFNRFMHPAVPRTAATYEFLRDTVRYTRDIGGIHFVFLTIWPDAGTRAWMARDLSRLAAGTPVIVVTHDQPDAEAKHFRNPNGAHDINATDQFENLLGDTMTDGSTIDVTARSQHAALEAFLKRHPNVSAYFHGNSNWNQFYDWTGPNHSIALHTFRVDSPMKGALSSSDETKLSFQVVTIDTVARTMTVRECLWNADPYEEGVQWGGSTTVALTPRP